MKQNKIFSYGVIAVIYIAASFLGILLYRVFPFDTWLSLLLADLAATVFVFLFSLLLRNASVYDPYWSVQPIVILWAFAVAVGKLSLPSILLLSVVTLWGVRLTVNWIYTFGDLTYEDWRYRMLAEKTGAFYPLINFVGIHSVPTLVVYFCTLPAVYVLKDGGGVKPYAYLFLLLSLSAVILQGTADIQMHAFRKNRRTPFIRTGLWKYSRHPNYLGEILMWWGVGLFALTVFPEKWYLMLAGAVLNTLLFLCVSIPMADRRQSRKVGFDTYKRQTRMLLPIYKSQK